MTVFFTTICGGLPLESDDDSQLVYDSKPLSGEDEVDILIADTFACARGRIDG